MYMSWWCCRGNLIMIILGSERVKIPHTQTFAIRIGRMTHSSKMRGKLTGKRACKFVSVSSSFLVGARRFMFIFLLSCCPQLPAVNNIEVGLFWLNWSSFRYAGSIKTSVTQKRYNEQKRHSDTKTQYNTGDSRVTEKQRKTWSKSYSSCWPQN